jgi:hypothetical protein
VGQTVAEFWGAEQLEERSMVRPNREAA